MPNNITIGQIGEELACRFLLNNKYKVIERNYREPWGEIDIIAKNKKGVLVFVEVKALKVFHDSVKQINGCFTSLTPEDNLSYSKLNKVKRTASLYANSHPDLINENEGWQIDLVAIEINCADPEDFNPKELLKYCRVRHYENI